MGDNFPHVIKGILGLLAGAGTSAMRAGGCCLLLAHTRGAGPPGANVISGNRAVTQHIWSRLPQKRWEPCGAPSPWSRSMVTCSIRGPAMGVVEGQFGKQWQRSRAGAPHSWKFASRGEQRNTKAPIDAAQLAQLPSIFS